ncbi:hypothetical protein [Lacibacter sp. H407]|uniref:hypothetical protein n=1 Tax=Lacibacter sp. H407 TaxID=3133423 RepID=UPI0030BAA69E
MELLDQEISFSGDDWRTRFVLYSKAELEDELYGVRDNIIRIVSDKKFSHPYYIADVFIKKNQFDDIRKSMYYSIDIINEFVSQVAVISYGECDLIEIISTTPYIVKPGIPFEMLLVQGDFHLKKIQIFRADIKSYSARSDKLKYVNLLTIIKDAINAESLETKFINYFSVLDYVAQQETTEMVFLECKNCNSMTPTQKATSKFLANLFSTYGINNKQYQEIRKLRSKIAHGSGIRNSEFYSEIRRSLSSLESIALQEISKRTGVTIKRRSSFVMDLPLLKLLCIKKSNPIWMIPSTFRIQNVSWSTTLSFSGIKNSSDNSAELDGDFGPVGNPSRPKVPNIAWPY